MTSSRRHSVNVTRRRITGAPNEPRAKQASESFLAQTLLRGACGYPPGDPLTPLEQDRGVGLSQVCGVKDFPGVSL